MSGLLSIVGWIAERLASALIAYAQREPYFHLPGYMERYWVIKPRRWFPWSVRVHHILRSDLDRHLHDHPWPWASLILRGGYFEITPGARRWYGPGSFRRAPATYRHKLILPEGTTTWSLFLMGRKSQTWGFYTEHGKVPWTEYLSASEVEVQHREHQRFGIAE